MTDTFEVPVVETPAIAEIVPPVEEPVAPITEEEPKQDEPTYTKAEVEQRIQERLAKAERKFERQLRDRLESENTLLRERQSEPKPVEAKGRPEREQFTSDVEYIRADARWEAEAVFNERQTAQQEHYSREAQARFLQEVTQTFETRADDVRKSNPDYDELVRNEGLAISQSMAEAIALSEHGPKVALYLAKNPVESLRIAKMPPSAAAYELGKLEAKVIAIPAKKISTAPAPMQSVHSTKSFIVDLENASQQEFEKALKKSGSRYVR